MGREKQSARGRTATPRAGGHRAAPAAVRAEALEGRTLLAAVPVGPPFMVNTYTDNDQDRASVAADAAGNFVVTWISRGGQDGSGDGIYAQRYAADGTPRGEEFLVNTRTEGSQWLPSVAMDADGNFVVVWEDMQYAEIPLEVHARRYDAAGVPQGEAATIVTRASSASVAMDADGDYVVAWGASDGNGTGVHAQRFAADGTARGEAFIVNTSRAGVQEGYTASMDADGDFVIAWGDQGVLGTHFGVYAQRYAADGTPRGEEFRVTDTTTAGAVAVDGAGGFAVAWANDDSGRGPTGVYARRYDAAGAARGEEVQVTSSAVYLSLFSLDSGAAGDFVVTWEEEVGDGSGNTLGVRLFARRYTAAGTPDGPAFLVDPDQGAGAVLASVAVSDGGEFVVAWTGVLELGSDLDVHARQFNVVNPPPPPGPVVADVLVSKSAWGSEFLGVLRSAGLGDGGYSLGTGAGQSGTVPWVNLDRVKVRFAGEVTAEEAEEARPAVRGAGVYAVSGFAFDPATKTATWTVDRPFATDRVVIDVEGARGPGGGEDAVFRSDVLPGDATRDGRVNALDLAAVKQRLNRTAANPGATGATYSPFADVTGDGRVNALDLSAVRQRINASLPPAPPPAVASFSFGTRRIAEDVLA